MLRHSCVSLVTWNKNMCVSCMSDVDVGAMKKHCDL
jgi:hypothetical protein